MYYYYTVKKQLGPIHSVRISPQLIAMGGSPGELSGACNVGEAKEGLENELWRG